MTQVHDPKNTEKIDTLWAVLSVDDTGNEGMVAANIAGTWFPIVWCYEKNTEKMLKFAAEVKANTNKKLRLVKFSSKEVIKEI